MTRTLIVGGGCTLAHQLAQHVFESVILERLEVLSGLFRSAHMEGVLYERHASHIFITEDREVWELRNRMTRSTATGATSDSSSGMVLNWPILLSGTDAQSRSDGLYAREEVDSAHLFPGSYPGWQARRGGQRFGELNWGGIPVRNVHLPDIDHARGEMVVNDPGLEYPFIRIPEAKHASRHEISGAALGFEFPFAPIRHYTTERQPHNRALNDRYQNFAREQIGDDRIFFADRLSNYVYIDMDNSMCQAMGAAATILERAVPGIVPHH